MPSASEQGSPQAPAEPSRGLRRLMKVSAVLLGCALLVLSALRAVPALARNPTWALILALLGACLADFISGLVHWAADTYGDARTPVFGNFVNTFRVHHSDPRDIARHDAVEANADVFLFSAPVHALLLVFVGNAFVSCFLVGLFCASYPNSQIHKWAHLPQRPRWVTRLQRMRLLLDPERHAGHHTGLHQTNYCITTGWLNPLLDRTRFFRGLEWLLERVGVARSPSQL